MRVDAYDRDAVGRLVSGLSLRTRHLIDIYHKKDLHLCLLAGLRSGDRDLNAALPLPPGGVQGVDAVGHAGQLR